MSEQKFVIRVYGIYINPRMGLLVSDELVYGKRVTKLPGGGLEYGEGLKDCIRRELKEETGGQFEVMEHFYTTDFFVESLFHEHVQVVSVYYLVKPAGELVIRTSDKAFDFATQKDGEQSFRFISLEHLSVDNFTLEIDRHVAGMIREKYKNN